MTTHRPFEVHSDKSSAHNKTVTVSIHDKTSLIRSTELWVGKTRLWRSEQ